ncbi:MAG: indole-3-glycerol-phosphate synthase [Pseudomonadota bacterium]
MADFLAGMATSSRTRADAAGSFRDGDFDRPVVPLSLAGFGVIAEIKQRSPAEGALASADSDRVGRAQTYAAAGATAISVLTEPERFDGALAHLDEVAAACPGTPVMRKDFLVDPVQVLEARRAGASGVLLIAAMLDDAALRRMLDVSFEHGMFVLLESFDEDDLQRSRALVEPYADDVDSGRLLFGVNTRNLRTLEVDPDRLERLAPMLPSGFNVAESGLKTAADAGRTAGWGYRLALVGTALMRSDDPAALIAGMRSAGSEALAA